MLDRDLAVDLAEEGAAAEGPRGDLVQARGRRSKAEADHVGVVSGAERQFLLQIAEGHEAGSVHGDVQSGAVRRDVEHAQRRSRTRLRVAHDLYVQGDFAAAGGLLCQLGDEPT